MTHVDLSQRITQLKTAVVDIKEKVSYKLLPIVVASLLGLSACGPLEKFDRSLGGSVVGSCLLGLAVLSPFIILGLGGPPKPPKK